MQQQFRSAMLVLVGVLLGAGGVFSLRAVGAAGQSASGGCQTFPQTGHKVCGKFLDYWRKNGGLAQQGYPLSEEFVETGDLNGKPYTVQYFERAVFEMHPENSPPYDVLLSQLGLYLGRDKYTRGFPAVSGEPPYYENRTSPAGALKSYYNAINRKEYERAYGYFQGAPNPPASLAPPYQQFVAGYADTLSVTLALGKFTQDAAAGNIYATAPVVITARHTNNSLSVFSGCYVLHRVSEGISPNPDDELWSISRATLSAAPANATIDALLAVNCRQ